MLDLERQYAPIRQELLDALGQVLDSRQFILGGAVARFEQEAAERLGVAHAVGCSSGTDALWLALAAAGVGPGHAVVTTPFSFFASASAILRAGARPVFADMDPGNFHLSPTAVQAVLDGPHGTRTRALLPVHLYGQTVAWEPFAAMASERGVTLVEDAAQAWDAEWKHKKAGALGAVAAFSFYPTKNLSAAGDAGMVTTNSCELAERLTMLRQHGMRRRYFHDEMGWNTRMDGFQGAILSVKLKYIGAWTEARREAAARYHALFAKSGLAETGPYPAHGVVLPREMPGAKHVWHQYTIRVPRRDALRAFLTAHSIGSEVYYPLPLHRQPALESLGYREGDFPEAERAAREALSLPIFPELRADEQETVVAAIADFLC